MCVKQSLLKISLIETRTNRGIKRSANHRNNRMLNERELNIQRHWTHPFLTTCENGLDVTYTVDAVLVFLISRFNYFGAQIVAVCLIWKSLQNHDGRRTSKYNSTEAKLIELNIVCARWKRNKIFDDLISMWPWWNQWICKLLKFRVWMV